jgi:hypothetical protein
MRNKLCLLGVDPRVNGGQEVQRRAGKKCGAGVEGIARGLGWPAAG